jgi:outer membrane receptor protein involved in Fe transport
MKRHPYRTFGELSLALLVLLGPMTSGHAQSAIGAAAPAAAALPATGAANADTAAPETGAVVVEGTEIEDAINPLERPISSIYGTDLNITDIPRAVTSVSSQQMEQQNISSISDLTQTSAGSNNVSRFGIIGSLTIRGDLAEDYTNGQRRLTNQNAFSPGFTGVGSADILNGPASVVDGPGSSTGGYVNFNTKLPYADKFQGEFHFDLGTYVPGSQSYFNPGWGIDFGGPIDKAWAYRVSYDGTGGQSYYYRNGINNDREDFYMAFTYTPNDKLNILFDVGYLDTDIGEIDGINRPTQGLVDNRTYYTGVADSPSNPPPAQIPGSIYYQPNTTGAGGFDAVLYPTGSKKIYPYEVEASPRNLYIAQDFYAQMIATVELADDMHLVNRTFGEGLDRHDATTYQYLEDVPRDFALENRTEFNWSLKQLFGLPIKNDIVAGLSFRFQDSLSYGEFQNEYFNNYDDTTKNRISPFYLNPTAFSNLIPIGNGFYANPGTTQIGANGSGTNGAYLTDQNTNQTMLYDTAVFLQDRTEFDKHWSTILGVRLDYIGGTATDPLANEAGNKQAPGTKSGDTLFVLNPTFSASLNYKPFNWATLYFTFDQTDTLDETALYETGGIPLSPSGDGSIPIKALKNKSDLYETGAKFSFLNNTLFAGVDAYDQKRTSTDQFGVINNIVVRGIEVQGTYQPDKHLNVTANFSYQEANYRDYAPIQSTEYEGDTYAAGFPVQPGVTGTGVGSPNFLSTLPAGRYRLNGFPDILFNAYVTYTLDCGLGAGIGPQVESEQADNFEGTIKIPAQYQFNATVYYRRPRYEVQVKINNLTDQRNWTVNDGLLEGNDLLLLNEPINFSATFRYRF